MNAADDDAQRVESLKHHNWVIYKLILAHIPISWIISPTPHTQSLDEMWSAIFVVFVLLIYCTVFHWRFPLPVLLPPGVVRLCHTLPCEPEELNPQL